MLNLVRLMAMKEILINLVLIDSSTTLVTPVGCPNSNSSDIIIVDNSPACVYNEQRCPYLDSIVFQKDVNKTLFCKGHN